MSKSSGDTNNVQSDAESAFSEFVRRRDRGEELDFDEFCAARPLLADALKILHSLRGDRGRGGPADPVSRPTTDVAGAPAVKPAPAPALRRFCIRCGSEIGDSPHCLDCDGIPNFYREVPGPDSRQRSGAAAPGAAGLPPPSLAATASAAAEELRREAAVEAPTASVDRFDRETSPSSPSMPLAVLRDVSGSAVEHPLFAGANLIGACRPASVVIDRAEVSSRHAQLRCSREAGARSGMVLTDLRSTNGTFVNGKRVRRCAVTPGDRVRFGSAEFEIRLIEPEAKRQTVEIR